MKIIDISWPITEDMTNYKDKQVVQFKQNKTFEKDSVRDSIITLGSHTGTHVDAPSHFLQGGKTADRVSLEYFIGVCKVFDLTQVTESISVRDLEKFFIESGDILLFKTKNSSLVPTQKFNYDFIFINKDAAQYLSEKNQYRWY